MPRQKNTVPSCLLYQVPSRRTTPGDPFSVGPGNVGFSFSVFVRLAANVDLWTCFESHPGRRIDPAQCFR